MIKLTLNAPMKQILSFIRNRLTLQMSEKQLKNSRFAPHMASLIWSKRLKDKIEDIDHTVYLIEESDLKASLLISTSPKIHGEIVYTTYGAALRLKDAATTELFIDRYDLARNRGLLPDCLTRTRYSIPQILKWILIVTLLLLAIVFWPLLIAVVVLGPIVQLAEYFKAKRKFVRMCAGMQVIVGIFEAEFSVAAKSDTKDWVTIWGHVKCGVARELEDFAGLKTPL